MPLNGAGLAQRNPCLRRSWLLPAMIPLLLVNTNFMLTHGLRGAKPARGVTPNIKHLLPTFDATTRKLRMIQRKQTLFLAASVILFLSTFGFPFGTIGTHELHNYKVMSADGTAVEGINTYYFSIPLAIASLISAYAIFLYNNRQRQMAIVRLSFIFYAASFALMSLYIMNAVKGLEGQPFSLGISFFLPFAAFFANLIALRGIKKDEQLIKSLDRLR